MKKRINLPIPYGWYCVSFSDELAANEIKPTRYFGQELILFRTASGKAVLSEAYCPHLGAHLGFGGYIENETVVCPFHGWKFTAEGIISEIPYATNIPPKI
jgi:3-ketosteroid 9alpha-monooxygenase subunit A